MSSPSSRPPDPGKGGGPLLVVISGPSGAGKDSVLAKLRERRLPAHFTITTTTRPKREVKPEDHAFLQFLTEEEFDELLRNDGLLEHAQVYGYRYGVPKEQVAEALGRGLDVIVRVDVQGAATIKRLVPQAVLIFLTAPSLDDLERRIRARGLDDDATVQRRLEAAARELERAGEFDHVIVNEDGRLDETAARVIEIMEAERTRPDRKAAVL